MTRISGTTRPSLRIALATATILSPAFAGAIDTSRDDVRAFVNDAVKVHGLDADYLLAVLTAAEEKQGILDAMARPAERTKPWHEYRAIFMTPARVDAGVTFWKDNEARLHRIAEQTGVPPEILAGILGVETYFGRRAGNHRLLDALATLAFSYPPRSKFFQSELTQLFLLARDERIDLAAVTGSYAGAMGPPQFMPSSYRQYAVDGDGDGRRDLFNSWDDILASVANYFVSHRWQQGQPVVARSTLAQPVNHQPRDNKLSPGETVGALASRGVRFSTDLDTAAPAGLIALEGDDGHEYWVAFHNFFVITRYNRSVMYALAVYQLGQAIGEAVRTSPGAPLRISGTP